MQKRQINCPEDSAADRRDPESLSPDVVNNGKAKRSEKCRDNGHHILTHNIPPKSIFEKINPTATQTAVIIASEKCKSPLIMSPLIKSRKEFVMRTPGISSMIFPIMIISTCCPGPTRHIRMHAIPEIREHKIFEKIAFIWTFANAYNVTRINAPTNRDAIPSHKFPPKKIANAPAVIA